MRWATMGAVQVRQSFRLQHIQWVSLTQASNAESLTLHSNCDSTPDKITLGPDNRLRFTDERMICAAIQQLFYSYNTSFCTDCGYTVDIVTVAHIGSLNSNYFLIKSRAIKAIVARIKISSSP
jgi:hypothetical protein